MSVAAREDKKGRGRDGERRLLVRSLQAATERGGGFGEGAQRTNSAEPAGLSASEELVPRC